MQYTQQAAAVTAEVNKAVQGKQQTVNTIWMAMLAGGHVLIEDIPGVGKTTLARIIANRTKASFIDFSAVTSGIKEIKTVMTQAEENRRFGEKTIVFVLSLIHI